MTEQEQKRRFQSAVAHRLASLQGDPRLAARIIAQSKGERPIMKRKIGFSLVLAMLLMLAASAALALGLVFSPRYDAARLAGQALESRYGITAPMMTLFSREVAENADGSATVTYAPVEESNRYEGNPFGVYTVTIRDGQAEASWSLDGMDTSGGLEAKAWGAEQLGLMLSDFSGTMAYLNNHSEAYRDALSAAARPTPPMTPEEYEALREQNRQRALEAAKLTPDQAKEVAVSALMQEYGLTSEQAGRFCHYDDETTYQMKGDRPTASLFFHLDPDGEDNAQSGIYVVEVCLTDGVVEDVLYDSGLAANP